MEATSVLGVNVGHETYESVLNRIYRLAERRSAGLVAFCNVHMVMTAYRDAEFRRRINEFDIVTPDGQPVRWGVNLLGRAGLRSRVYGPELMLRLCSRVAGTDTGVFLYGSYEDRNRLLRQRLVERFPGLRVVGCQPSRFRPSTREEDDEDIAMINDSGARIVFIGMGCPLQENWAYEHRRSLNAVLLCVGGAFDFHSGTVRHAPMWMQQYGLEWFFRVSMEPRRLWRRYLFNNFPYLVLLGLQWVGLKRFPDPPNRPDR